MPSRLSFREDVLLFYKRQMAASPRGSAASKGSAASTVCDPMWRTEEASYPEGRTGDDLAELDLDLAELDLDLGPGLNRPGADGSRTIDLDALPAAAAAAARKPSPLRPCYTNGFEDLKRADEEAASDEDDSVLEDDAWIDPALELDEDGLPAVNDEAVASGLPPRKASVPATPPCILPADALAAFMAYDAQVRAEDAALRAAVARTEQRRREVAAEVAAALRAKAPAVPPPARADAPLGPPPQTSLAAQLPLDVAQALIRTMQAEQQARLAMQPQRVTCFGLSSSSGPSSIVVSPV